MNTYVVRPKDEVAEDYDISFIVVNAESKEEAMSFHPHGEVEDPTDEELESRIRDWPVSTDLLVVTPIQSMGAGIISVEERF